MHCGDEYHEEWDFESLLTEVGSYYPTKFTVDELSEAGTTEELVESLLAEAMSFYEQREEELGAEMMRELERRIMLQIIDQHWVEHLSEMDYLLEGIQLRAMGQKDPLVEWKREGFEMFGKMIDAIEDDYLKYVMHVQVVVEQPDEPDLSRAVYQAAEDPVQAPSAHPPANTGDGITDVGGAAAADVESAHSPIVRSPDERVGRNDPCYCGSGKKFKHCHGALSCSSANFLRSVLAGR